MQAGRPFTVTPDVQLVITPQPCETAIAADQQFVITGSYGLDTLTRLHANPPQFELETLITSASGVSARAASSPRDHAP